MENYHNKHLDVSEESPIYAGTGYLASLIRQMDLISRASREALRYGGDTLLGWLNELKIFHDLISLQMNLDKSDKDVDFKEYVFVGGEIKERIIKIKEKDKYKRWFLEIESLIEKNAMVKENETSLLLKYNNDKRIKMEIGDCQRELYKDANKKNIIMPKPKENMKELAKAGWIDRDFKKEF